MAFDLARARADTQGCRHVLHFNNAGAALMPAPVVEAQLAHLRREAEIGGYEAAEEAAPAIEACYDSLARLLNCGRDEVALMENATLAWNQAFHALELAAGDRILTAEAEYASNYIAFLKLAGDRGVVVEALPSDASGQVSTAALAERLDPQVKLIAITHVPTNGGLVNPAAAIGRLAREAGVPFLLDACQSAGQLDLDVTELGCDLLSASGRKYLRGPRGSGFLYVRRGLLEQLEPPFLDLRGATWVAPGGYRPQPDARRFENWEFNYAAVLGLGAAVDYALGWGLEAIEARVAALAEQLRGALAEVPGVRVHDLGERRCGLVTFTLDGHDAEAVRQALHRDAINVSTSSAASTRLDMERRRLPTLVRASVHYYNSEDEVTRFCHAVARL